MASKFGFISLAVLFSVALQSARSQGPDSCGQAVLLECVVPLQIEYAGLEFEDLITKMKKEGLSGDCKRAKAVLKCVGKQLSNDTSCLQLPPPLVSVIQDILTKEEGALKYTCEDQFTTMNKIHNCFLDNVFGVMMNMQTCVDFQTFDYLPPCQQMSKAVNCLVKTVKDVCKTSDEETAVARTAYQNFLAPVSDLNGCQKFLKKRHMRNFLNFILRR